MKAIVMAGGEGTRLRPLTNCCPKPMVKLMDKPVLEHTIELLKENGITDICVTLKYMPKAVIGYFGSGEDRGVRLTCRVEKEALGTAGSVRACGDFVGDEDFLVISGDAVCDFDLRACIDFHRERRADATIVLYSHPEPLEYGLVVTDASGRIRRFIEKPAWGEVLTDRINTGIYIISSRVLQEIPMGEKYDFGRDLFPKLLQEGKKLFGVTAQGYWCDIGSPEAYRMCCRDILDGKCRITLPAAKIRGGVWAESCLPQQHANIIPPVYIGKNVSVAQDAKIGPYAVLLEGSSVRSGAVVRGSVLLGASVGENAYIDGAIMGHRAYAGSGASLQEGCVIGENTVLGSGCVVQQGVRIWPGRCVPRNMLVTSDIAEGMLQPGIVFDAPGVIRGKLNVTVTPEACFTLGAVMGGKKVSIARSGGDGARLLAEAISCGVCSAGGEALMNDASSASMASFAAEMLGTDYGVFVQQEEERLSLYFCGRDGSAITRQEERKIEAASAGQVQRQSAAGVGGETAVTGIFEMYTNQAGVLARGTKCGGFTVAVTGSGGGNRALRAALTKAGFRIGENRHGVPQLQVVNGGADLVIRDERGETADPGKTCLLAAFAEMERGSGTVAVPPDAPAAAELLAEQLGTKVLRVGRDGEAAQALLRKQPFMRDGVFAAVKICAFAAGRGETIADLLQSIPKFSTTEREVIVDGSKSRIMRALAAVCGETAAEFWDGLRVHTERGHAHIAPCASRPALRIRTESGSMEAASQLCAELERAAREIQILENSGGKNG